MPAIQSIGLGSDNALKSETLEKLKQADEQAAIDPIKKRITEVKKQNTELSTLLVSIAGMKGAQNPLSDELEYLKVSTKTFGDSVNPVVSAGVSPQNINIQVKQLAQEDIIQSKSFKLKEDTLSLKDATMNISIDGRAYEIKIKGSEGLAAGEKATTLEDLPNLILEATSGKIIGSILNTGGDNPFTLVLKSREVGGENAILIGTIVKSSKVINEGTLKETIFKKNDFLINNVNIFGKITNVTHTSEAIDENNNLPFQFNPGDLFINDVDIFNNTTKTNVSSSALVDISAEAKDGDFKLNEVNIFDTSGFSETKSSFKLESINYPLDIGLNTLSLNGISIFDSIKPTTITTAVLKDDSIEGTYKLNNLMINGVSIFDVDTVVDSLASMADYINLKTDDTSVSASIVTISGNKKLELTNEITGDNIDINSNDPLVLAKLRLTKGVTLGNTTNTIEDTLSLISAINSKTADSDVEALEIDGHLVFRSAKKSGRITIKAEDESFIDKIGLKEGTYNKSIPIKIESLDDVVLAVNKKTSEHNIVASNKDGKLYLEHDTLGENIEIGGKQTFLDKLELSLDTITPTKGKLVSSIEDLANTINGFTSSTFIQASKVGDKLLLKSNKEGTDILIAGKEASMDLIGLKSILIEAINGEIIQSIESVVEKINDQSLKTNVHAFIGNDKRITLLNTLGEDIKISGTESQINIVSFSIDDTLILDDANINKTLLEKLGVSQASQKLQNAQDAVFRYNGVEISRTSNSVTDIVNGIDFQLKKVDKDNSNSSISISKNKDTVINSFFEFVTSYNSFIRKITDLTKFTYDEDNPKDSDVGVFQGKTTISSLPSKLSTILGTVYYDSRSNRFGNNNADNNGSTKMDSLISLGIDFSRDGTLTYEEDKVRNNINANFEDVEKLFRGYTKTSLTGVEEKVKGVFKKFNDKINDLTKGEDSVLESFKSSIEKETSRLESNLKQTQTTIDNKNEQLKQSFIANDSAIGKITNNFASLKQQIEYDTAK